jgi:hypothetical protein
MLEQDNPLNPSTRSPGQNNQVCGPQRLSNLGEHSQGIEATSASAHILYVWP